MIMWLYYFAGALKTESPATPDAALRAFRCVPIELVMSRHRPLEKRADQWSAAARAHHRTNPHERVLGQGEVTGKFAAGPGVFAW
ncbi:hypothetical protein ACVJGD_000426 [Bradyrhizobium sp. USDA 10063]